jgi:type VI secretion system protein ImpG
MDPRMLQYYNQELQYIREMGAEFAARFPKIAARLALDSVEVADPYVERLLEGFSFLSARVRLKLDAEFPRFAQHLLGVAYPHYLSPTPAMTIAQFVPTVADPALAGGFVMPRGTVLRGQMPRGEVTACQFRTAHPVTLWPIELVEARYQPLAPDLPLNTLRLAEPIRGVVRLRLRTATGLPFQQIALDRLNLFLGGADDIALKLYELILGSGLGVLVAPPARPVPWFEWLGGEAIQPVGFETDQALIPYTSRSFSGYRLLHEYFAFPERFRFIELGGLRKALSRHGGDEIEVAVPLARGEAALGPHVERGSFALHCTPVINLFRRRSDRTVERVLGYGEGVEAQREFRPFYASVDAEDRESADAYFTVRREPRALSETQRRDGARTGYIGSEVFLSLVDAREAPYSSDIRQLAVEVLATNRDLPLLMQAGGDAEFSLAESAPVDSVRCLRSPSRPRSAIPEGEMAWRLINHLSLNYLTVTDLGDEQGAAALRELLELYADLVDADAADALSRRQVLGVRRVAVTPRTRIEHFFGRLASMNTFTELVLVSETRGEIRRWPPRMAARQLV